MLKWFGLGKKDRWRLSRINRDGVIVGSQLLCINPSGKKKEYPHLIYFRLPYESRPLPSKSEFDRFDIVDTKLEELSTRMGFKVVGVMCINGFRDWILYAQDESRAVEGLNLEMAQFEPELTALQDPGWKQYSDLLKTK